MGKIYNLKIVFVWFSRHFQCLFVVEQIIPVVVLFVELFLVFHPWNFCPNGFFNVHVSEQLEKLEKVAIINLFRFF